MKSNGNGKSFLVTCFFSEILGFDSCGMFLLGIPHNGFKGLYGIACIINEAPKLWIEFFQPVWYLYFKKINLDSNIVFLLQILYVPKC